ncbi:hypothetical protein [uncultured Treponema sp.]|uniref:hypothetical protein n=1 Tax=uncultured Treponema sp. TaxID=162155 RepID=UPI0025F31F19|nr:hypothetical protein [uncultured Treponema sp.]
MKSFKKVFFGISALLFFTVSGILISCSNDDDEDGNNPVSQPSPYSISISSEDKAILLAPGATKTISVTKKGNMIKPAAVEGLTVSLSNSENTITITAAASITERTEKSVKVTLSEDSSKSVTINVTIDPTADVTIDAYDLTLSLDAAIASSAATITVYAEGKEDGVDCPENKKQTVTADYTAGATSAVAKLDKAKANEWKYFNNIVVTVTDAAGNEIPVDFSPVYFDYSNTEFSGITISATSTSKTFTINFEGFTVVGGSVSGLKVSNTWYESVNAWQENTTITPTVTVAADGKSATFDIASSDLTSSNEFYIDWTSVVVKDSAENAIAINSGNTESNKWYSYGGTEWSNKLEVVNSSVTTLVSAETLTISAEGTYQLVVAYDSIKAYNSVYITLAAITAWGNGNYDLPCLGTGENAWKENTKWVDKGAFADSNVTSTTGGYYAVINPADYTDGVFITGKTGLSGTLFVSGN